MTYEEAIAALHSGQMVHVLTHDGEECVYRWRDGCFESVEAPGVTNWGHATGRWLPDTRARVRTLYDGPIPFQSRRPPPEPQPKRYTAIRWYDVSYLLSVGNRIRVTDPQGNQAVLTFQSGGFCMDGGAPIPFLTLSTLSRYEREH